MNEFLQIFMSIIGVIAGCYVVFLFYDRIAGLAVRYTYRRLTAKYQNEPVINILGNKGTQY